MHNSLNLVWWRENAIQIVIHILFWILSGWLILSSFSVVAYEAEIINNVETVRVQRDASLIKHLILCLVFAMIMFYCIWIMIRRSHFPNNLTIAILSRFFLPVVTVILIYRFTDHYLLTSYLPGLPDGLWISILSFYMIASVAFGLFRLWYDAEYHRRTILLQKNQAELLLLRAQLQPHFLFNILNNLLSMVDQKTQPLLSASISKLSGLLRYVISETGVDKVPIAKEIDFIRNFADLYSLSFEPDEIDFRLEITGEHIKQFIEPGILVPIVENAFKYGTTPERRSMIRVSIDLQKDNSLICVVENPIFDAEATSQAGMGTGLHNLRERLRLVYPHRHELLINSDQHYYQVKLIINGNEGNHSRR